jgi:hypothetical protein
LEITVGNKVPAGLFSLETLFIKVIFRGTKGNYNFEK